MRVRGGLHPLGGKKAEELVSSGFSTLLPGLIHTEDGKCRPAILMLTAKPILDMLTEKQNPKLGPN
jgi:hypothetical protein